MSHELTIILSSFDREVRQKLGSRKTKTQEQKSVYSWEKLGCEGKSGSILVGLGLGWILRWKQQGSHLNVKSSNPQMGNAKVRQDHLWAKV